MSENAIEFAVVGTCAVNVFMTVVAVSRIARDSYRWRGGATGRALDSPSMGSNPTRGNAA